MSDERVCPHTAANCSDCRAETEREKLAAPAANSWGYDHCSARSYFASRALEALHSAGAPRSLIQMVEEFRVAAGNTGD